MKALGTNVVIRPIVEEVKSKSGLIMTSYTEKDIRHKKGEVVSAGSDVEGLNEGDKVYYDSAAASNIRIEGEKLIVINDRQIAIKL